MKERKKKGKGGSYFSWFFWVLSMGREQKRERGVRSSTFFLRYTEIGSSNLIGPRVKAHLLGEGYAWALKSRSFDTVLDFRFSGSRKFRV